MLLLALVALVLPGDLPAGPRRRAARRGRACACDFGSKLEMISSLASRILLLLSYCAGLFFSLRTHRDLFNPYTTGTRTRSRLAGARAR